MDSTVAVQINGSGFSFQAARNSLMAAIRSSTLKKESRRILLPVNSPNQRSIRFSQLELVELSCTFHRGWRLSQSFTWSVLLVPEFSITTCSGFLPENAPSI